MEDSIKNNWHVILLLLKHVKARPHMKRYRSDHYFIFIRGGGGWGKFYSFVAERCDFCHFFGQIEWKLGRRWHHELTYMHIHIECLRDVSWKIEKLYNFISSIPLLQKFNVKGNYNYTPILRDVRQWVTQCIIWHEFGHCTDELWMMNYIWQYMPKIYQKRIWNVCLFLSKIMLCRIV